MSRALLAVFCILTAGLAISSRPMPVAAGGNALLPGAVGCRGTDMMAELRAEAPRTAAAIAQSANETENSAALFWRIEKAGIAPSHLLGTVHLTDHRVTFLPEAVTTALRESKTVAVEVADLSAGGAAAAMASAGTLAVFTDGRSLETLLAPEDFQKVSILLEQNGVPEAAARLFRPWIISLMLASSECERQKVERGEPVLDQKIAQEAQALSIPLVGLETAESQLRALASVPEKDQIDMLRAALATAGRSGDLIETMVVMYTARRIAELWPFQMALAAKAGIAAQSFESFNEIVVVKRNHAMRDAAVPHLGKGGAFIAVGALHLVGPEGLVALFREAGYTVSAAE